jgi:hypothetical protein
MPTNKVMLRSVEQFMADYKPIYTPIYSAFLGNSQAYSQEAGKISFNRLEAVSDLRAKHLTPKDTVIDQISVIESSKIFKKYFLGKQFIQSALQDNSRTEQVIAQVLNEHVKHMDDLFLLGEGTSNSTMINNGLFWSGDANYSLESSVDYGDISDDPLVDLHKQMMITMQRAKQIDGQKLVIVYGTELLPYFNGVYAASSIPFKTVLSGALAGDSFAFAELPADVTPASANGWIVATLPQVKLHYTALPALKDQGVNPEKMYSWHNFLMGSCMVDVLCEDAIIRQPAAYNAGA